MRKLFHFFIDGLGLGEDTEENPVRSLFSSAMDGGCLVKRDGPLRFSRGVMIPTDPVMGVQGIPQSATGQTSIFTGVNAQALLGHHLTAFPNEKLVSLIKKRSLLKILKKRGIGVTSANMYTKEFFASRSKRRKNMFPVSSLSVMAARIPFRYPEDYHRKQALFTDITNEMIRERGYDVPLLTPEEGAERIVNILNGTPAVFFEYFMTDVLGHRKDRKGMLKRVDDLDRFLLSLLEMTSDWRDFTILISSDHGNSEDLSSGDHTTNNVPSIIFSDDPNVIRMGEKHITNLTSLYDFVLAYFSE